MNKYLSMNKDEMRAELDALMAQYEEAKKAKNTFKMLQIRSIQNTLVCENVPRKVCIVFFRAKRNSQNLFNFAFSPKRL